MLTEQESHPRTPSLSPPHVNEWETIKNGAARPLLVVRLIKMARHDCFPIPLLATGR